MLLMSRQNKAGAISALLIGLLVLAVCLASVGTRASAIARLQGATATTTLTPTPCDDDPDVCSDDATDAAIDALTAVADNLTATAQATPSPGTATSTTTPGTGTPTATRTPTLLPTNQTAVATLAPSPFVPTATIDHERLAPTETPTPIPDNVLTCFPGQPLVLTGDGPARAPFLVYFAERVVSGGSVSPSGRFAATLIVGQERAGVYPIAVRVRGTSRALLETSCVVPNVTPTLVPRARELP
jgi:hypothetical protein